MKDYNLNKLQAQSADAPVVPPSNWLTLNASRRAGEDVASQEAMLSESSRIATVHGPVVAASELPLPKTALVRDACIRASDDAWTDDGSTENDTEKPFYNTDADPISEYANKASCCAMGCCTASGQKACDCKCHDDACKYHTMAADLHEQLSNEGINSEAHDLAAKAHRFAADIHDSYAPGRYAKEMDRVPE